MRWSRRCSVQSSSRHRRRQRGGASASASTTAIASVTIVTIFIDLVRRFTGNGTIFLRQHCWPCVTVTFGSSLGNTSKSKEPKQRKVSNMGGWEKERGWGKRTGEEEKKSWGVKICMSGDRVTDHQTTTPHCLKDTAHRTIERNVLAYRCNGAPAQS